MSDLIGFIISLLALVYIMYKQAGGKRRPEQDADEEDISEGKREQALHDFLKSLGGDMEEAKEYQKRPSSPPPKPVALKQVPKAPAPPPMALKPVPHRAVSDHFLFKSKIEDYKPKTEVEQRKLDINIGQAQFDEYGNKVVSEDLQTQGQHAYRIESSMEKSRLKIILQTIPSKRDMLIYQEVMGPPKAFRQLDAHDYI